MTTFAFCRDFHFKIIRIIEEVIRYGDLKITICVLAFIPMTSMACVQWAPSLFTCHIVRVPFSKTLHKYEGNYLKQETQGLMSLIYDNKIPLMMSMIPLHTALVNTGHRDHSYESDFCHFLPETGDAIGSLTLSLPCPYQTSLCIACWRDPWSGWWCPS